MFKEKDFDFDKYGAFFAFSKKQFEEQKKEGEKYSQTQFGLLIPTDKMKECLTAFKKHIKAEKERRKKEIGIYEIIKKEFYNYEVPIGNIEDIFFLIEDLGITKEYLLATIKEIAKKDKVEW